MENKKNNTSVTIRIGAPNIDHLNILILSV
jgi:hypothetical protein